MTIKFMNMKRTGPAVLAASALALCSTPGWAAELIINGGFEMPVVNSTCCNTVPPDLLLGWTATPNVNVVVGTYASTNGNLAAEGNQYLDLVGQGGTGSISQTFASLAGTVYNLSFVYSHNLFNPNADLQHRRRSRSTDCRRDQRQHWHQRGPRLAGYSAVSRLTGPTATLNFTYVTGGVNEGILLDAVSVQAVPEPATWAMMLLGFGAVGFQIRRRRPATLAQLA